MKRLGKQSYCLLDIIKPYQQPKLVVCRSTGTYCKRAGRSRSCEPLPALAASSLETLAQNVEKEVKTLLLLANGSKANQESFTGCVFQGNNLQLRLAPSATLGLPNFTPLS